MTVIRREGGQSGSRVGSGHAGPDRIASSRVLHIVPLVVRRLEDPSSANGRHHPGIRSVHKHTEALIAFDKLYVAPPGALWELVRHPWATLSRRSAAVSPTCQRPATDPAHGPPG